jgi:hypothetical protein
MRFSMSSAVLAVLAITCGPGCTTMARWQHREERRIACQEYYGVDDPVFHGHKKTCWRKWDDPAWAAQPCYQCCPATTATFTESAVPDSPSGAEAP